MPDSNLKNNSQSSGITDCFYTLVWQRKAKTKEYVQRKSFDHSKDFFPRFFFDEQQKKQNTLITYSHLSIYIQFETPL